jgi:cell division protein FtsB
VASGPRSTARPGAGPGRGRARTRKPLKRPPSPARKPAEAVAPQTTTAWRFPRPPSGLTTRAIALAVVFLILTISYATSLRIYFHQARQIASARTEITTRQQRIPELQGELALWNDAEYVKTQARDRLGWVVPGQTGFRVIGPDGRPLGGGAEIGSGTVPQEASTDAWWSRLWGSVEAADNPAPVREDPAEQPPITEKTVPRDAPPSPTASASPR